MRILVDMNLSPDWVDTLKDRGIEAIHWASVGRADAPDRELMSWAPQRDYLVFTHDLGWRKSVEEDARIPNAFEIADDEANMQAIETARNALSEARKYSPGCPKQKSKQTLSCGVRPAPHTQPEETRTAEGVAEPRHRPQS